MKNTTRILLATVALFLAGGTQVQAGQCIDVGGSALGQAVTPTSLVASWTVLLRVRGPRSQANRKPNPACYLAWSIIS